MKATLDSLQQGKVGDRVLINVGGKRHETYLSTISNFQDTRLFWIAETASKMADFDPQNNEFFFDRHPGCFENILNFCRTGKLHCPNDVCGPLFEEELAFWGVDELQMEPCCWGTYTQHRNAHKHLKMFDQQSTSEQEYQEQISVDKGNTSKFRKNVTKYRAAVWAALEEPYSSRYAQVAALINLAVILLSIASFCIETMPIAMPHEGFFRKLEYFYCGFFTIDFFIRFSCCPSYKKFLKSLYSWIDFISIVQFYINFWLNSDTFDFLFVLRLIRIFRLFRFFKNLSGMQVIGQTLKASARELFLLILIVLIPMVIFSSLIYYAEKSLAKPTFGSIPEAFWWAIITMTTVGYGDVTPESTAGKIVNSLCACLGVLILALPVSVIGSNFTLYYSYAQARIRLPKRAQHALVMADKALVGTNPGKRAHDGSQSSRESSWDDNDVVSQTDFTGGGGGGGIVSRGLIGLADVVVELTVPMQRRQAISPGISPISFSLDPKATNAGSIDPAIQMTNQARASKGSTTSCILPAITVPIDDADQIMPEVAEEDQHVNTRLLSVGSSHLIVPRPHGSIPSTCEDDINREHESEELRNRNAELLHRRSGRSKSESSDDKEKKHDYRNVNGRDKSRSSSLKLRSSTQFDDSNMSLNSDNRSNNNIIILSPKKQRLNRKHGSGKLLKLFRRPSKDHLTRSPKQQKSDELKRKFSHLDTEIQYRRPRNGTSAGLDKTLLFDRNGLDEHEKEAGLVSPDDIHVTKNTPQQKKKQSRDSCSTYAPPFERSRSPTFDPMDWNQTSTV